MAETTTDPPPTESNAIKEHLRVLKLVLYIIIFVASVLANSFLLLVLWRKFRRHRKTAKSFIYLMQNLAISGLVLVISSIPFDSAWHESNTWPFGPAGCKIIWPLQTASFQAMVHTYMVLAFHRLYGVKKELYGQMKLIYAIVATFAIWIASIITVIPYVLALEYNYVNDTCDERWGAHSKRQGYTMALFLLHYLLPLLAIVVMYVMVVKQLRRYRVLDPERACRRDRHHRIIRLMVVYVLVFAIFLLPHQIMWLVLDFGDGANKPYFEEVLHVLYIFAYGVTVVNPVLFFVFNPEFKRDFWHYFKCRCVTKKEMFTLTDLSESFSEESDHGPRPKERNHVPTANNAGKLTEPTEASTPTLSRLEIDAMPPARDQDSGLELVEAGMFRSTIDRLRTTKKEKEYSPSASPPGSDVFENFTNTSFDQSSEML